MAKGLSSLEIAARVFASMSHGQTRVGATLRKLSLRDRVQIVALAHEHGLVHKGSCRSELMSSGEEPIGDDPSWRGRSPGSARARRVGRCGQKSTGRAVTAVARPGEVTERVCERSAPGELLVRRRREIGAAVAHGPQGLAAERTAACLSATSMMSTVVRPATSHGVDLPTARYRGPPATVLMAHLESLSCRPASTSAAAT